MRDINFFAPYVKQQETSVTNLIMTTSAAVVVVGIAGTLGYNIFQTSSLDKDIAAVNAKLTEPTFVSDYQYSNEILLEKNLFTGYNTALMTVHDGIIDRSMIDTEIMKQINSTVPSGVNLKSLAIEGNTITMNVTSSSDKQAADFKYNLDKLPMIKKSFIPAINSDFGSPEVFTFSITCTLEEGYYEN